MVSRRVRISVAVFVALIAEDVLIGIKPHGVFDYADPRSLAGCGLIFAGLVVRSWAAGILRKTRELTVIGPYALVRNPLYVGSFLIMIGFCVLIGDRENLFVILGPFFGLYFLQVLHEERVLAVYHPEAWNAYVRNVPRFFPRRLSTAAFGAWTFAIWRSNREYRALGAVLLGMLLIDAWRLLHRGPIWDLV
ncbi:MAG: isoprenylcysteine carboxylmethyltransferase family protein [Pirellulales bacterium]|nr:isoprenylcysteine carboxylmethyltransferase family protein [Pirellulales bacterium]